jgi:hypothetical protein
VLAKSDFDVAKALELLGRHGVEAALIVPTPTGLQKSIFDATESLREYLMETGFHNFSDQKQGGEHKVSRELYFVKPGKLQKSNLSMYRPPTKSGDPRIWTGAATKENANPFNLLAVVVLDGVMYVLNMSDASVRASLLDAASPFRKIIDAKQTASPVATELLEKIRKIAEKGFIQTLRPGPTGVGMTLETLLGIAANSSRSPDYKGIEIKAKRGSGSNASNRSTLFSKAPNWKLSPVGSALSLLNKHGWLDAEGRLQLYHTLQADKVNTKNLLLEVDGARDWLKQVSIDPETNKAEHDVTWEMAKLRKSLSDKHRETFWVQAECRGRGQDESFRYAEVRHTRKPMALNFSSLVEAGIITVDYAMHLKNERVRDHGYLFKIHPKNMGALFAPPKVHVLA